MNFKKEILRFINMVEIKGLATSIKYEISLLKDTFALGYFKY